MTKVPKCERKIRSAAGSAASPAATGPAGSHFEGQVGASYLLCMLADSEPRGMPARPLTEWRFNVPTRDIHWTT